MHPDDTRNVVLFLHFHLRSGWLSCRGRSLQSNLLIYHTFYSVLFYLIFILMYSVCGCKYSVNYFIHNNSEVKTQSIMFTAPAEHLSVPSCEQLQKWQR